MQQPPPFEPTAAGPAWSAPPTSGATAPAGAARTRELRRSRDRKLAGVCGGLAEYFDVDPVIVRLLFFGGMFMGLATLPVYLAAWVVMPDTVPAAPPAAVADDRIAA